MLWTAYSLVRERFCHRDLRHGMSRFFGVEDPIDLCTKHKEQTSVSLSRKKIYKH